MVRIVAPGSIGRRTGAESLPSGWDNGQQDLRGVKAIVKHSNIRFFHLCAVHFRLSTLEVA
jgi:hypothetical protein